MKKLLLTSPIPPSVNNYLNYKIERSGRRQFVRAYPSAETVKYQNQFKKYVEEQIRLQGWQIPEKGKIIFVRIIFYFERKRKDPNNYLKVPLDVFSDAGVYYDDDCVLPLCDRVYIDKANPRLEIEVFESNFSGIFESAEEERDFISSNCNYCKKDQSKCTLLRRAHENRLVDEFEEKNCKKLRKK